MFELARATLGARKAQQFSELFLGLVFRVTLRADTQLAPALAYEGLVEHIRHDGPERRDLVALQKHRANGFGNGTFPASLEPAMIFSPGSKPSMTSRSASLRKS